MKDTSLCSLHSGHTSKGYRHTDESKALMSNAAKHRPEISEKSRERRRNSALKMWENPEYQKNQSDGMKESYKDDTIRNNHRNAILTCAKDPNWRANVSRKTKEALNQPEIKTRHLEALNRIANEIGNPYERVGKGRKPQAIMLEYAEILCPAGYLMDKINIPKGTWKGASYYTLDFGHPEAKVDIEIDGSSHKNKQKHDAERDAFLQNLGWKIIRIKV
jgi:hypothetical protein